MRQRSGCKACRERHIKCVKLRDSEKCKYCTERKRPCIRGNAFRFRPVTAVKFNAGEDVGSAEQSLEFRGSQTWVAIPNSLRFVPPNTDGDEAAALEAEAEAEPESASDDSTQVLQPTVDGTFDEVEIFSYPDRSAFQPLQRTDSHGSQDISTVGGLESGTDLPLIPHIDIGTSSQHVMDGADLAIYDRVVRSRIDSSDILSESLGWSKASHNLSPANLHNNSPSLHRSPHETNFSPFSGSAFSPSASLHPKWPVSNEYEARLFHHFIVHCTNWIDVCDARRHFEKEVPKRAAHFSVIRDGIFGLSARHLWLMGKVKEDHSQPYVDQCLQALIVALEDPLAHWDENFLVAVILLRLHEEMGEADEQCHHFGTARILNTISSFAADGGLRESASWVSLRQHIYVSLTTQQPINLSLDNYRHSSVFREFDDESWANRIIFHFATILQHVFEDHPESNTSSSLTREKWAELDADVEEWHRTKPWHFAPFHVDPSAGKEFKTSWPEMFTANGVIAVGMQYYHLCKILLTIYSPNSSLVGLAGVRARRTTDATIRQHIRITIGYGVTNSHCGNAMFQGSHILSACGAYIVDKREQSSCIAYLKGLQKVIGWRTDKVVTDLLEQWRIE
ncbi:hypothetical protein BS50DRAFT_575458 [Corynespora cassiicola Philippines]|uniref:Zn(2)-C6 fungal-type domain-containing protein n=1 Tax=Corynespora cassiicola Philippines TaxID=1448308 RepID=A0A2T2NJ33_CORCC|nr:hypothetical protein BS50DRAFT_575458 [Corynespora cassiicola Philippines]